MYPEHVATDSPPVAAPPIVKYRVAIESQPKVLVKELVYVPDEEYVMELAGQVYDVHVEIVS